MAGFFKSSKLKSVTGPQRSCHQCGLISSCKNPKMSPTGRGKKGIFILGDFPDRRCDKNGVPIAGNNAKLLKKTLYDQGVSLERDCVMMNAINCCPGKNIPSSVQVEACRKSIQTEYKRAKPALILLMGNSATKSHWGHRWKYEIDSVYSWRGFQIPDHHFNCWTAPVYNPSFLGEEATDDVARVIWKDDIIKALSYLDRPLPEKIDEDSVTIFTEEKDGVAYLQDLWRNPPEFIVFDYETTGLKPHHPGHEIVCVGIATERDNGVAFFLTERIIYMLKKVLSKTNSKKIAQNMKFEETWTRFILGVKVRNWYFDPMLASHVLDNRPRISKLKFQSFVQFGVCDYDSHIAPFLKSVDGSSNGFNRIHKAPKHDLLVYCALDALLEYRLAMKQMKEIGMKETEPPC